MKIPKYIQIFYLFLLLAMVLSPEVSGAQETSKPPKRSSDFWSHVQFGGGLGGSFGSGYSDLTIAPGALYNFNEQFGLGLGLQYSYISQKDLYNSHLYGANVVGLFNPIEEIQLSLEVEQLRVNLEVDEDFGESRDFWNTGLFVGAGYRAGNVTIGGRYNVLFSEDKNVYSAAFMPFIRAYF